YDLHEALGAQLPRDRAEDAGADRLELGREQHGGIRVELHQRAVAAAYALGRAHHDRVVDLALLDPTPGRPLLAPYLDHVTHSGIAALGAAQHLDAHDRARTRVVGHVQNGLHLYHRVLAKTLLQLDPQNCAAASIGARPGRSPGLQPGESSLLLALREDAATPRGCGLYGHPAESATRDSGSYTILAFSSSFTTRQDFIRESGRHSSIVTRSPSLHSLVSSCAWYFPERVTTLP